MSSKKNEVETTGHSWDGIEEYNNPLPKWWVYIFYLCIIWGVGYTIAYPAWPLLKEATPGVLGFSTRAEVAEDIAEVDAMNAALTDKLASVEDLTTIIADEELHGFAVNAGAAVFRANCSQCHGSGAAGVQASGYPNLLDNDWIWGGTIEEIAYTITHGIRNEQSEDTRWSQMPAFGELLEEQQIANLVQYVRSLAGEAHDAEMAAAGAEDFEYECASCHGAEGMGDKYQGAPNLTDAIWLYGGDEASLTETITNARFGVMPAWSNDYRIADSGLTQAEINAVASYVHQLGGGVPGYPE